MPEIKRVDRAQLATERRALSSDRWHWPELDGVEPLDLEIEPWPPDEAVRAFAARYAELAAGRDSSPRSSASSPSSSPS